MSKDELIIHYQNQINSIKEGFLNHRKRGECFCTDCEHADARIFNLEKSMSKVSAFILAERYPPDIAAQ